MAKYVTEFIGTFFLVLVIGLTGNPIAIGTTLMVMVYMGGHVSGAHYNPAVTLAVTMRGRCETSEAPIYMASQILGALAAGFVVYLAADVAFAPAPAAEANMAGVLLVEFLFTFALCLVVLNTATAKATEGNSFYGLAIGFTVLAAAFAGGPISGGAFNPAVGVGPILTNMLFGDGTLGDIWIYIVMPLAGGVLAAITFKMQNPGDD